MKRVIFILMFALALFSCKSYKPASGNPYYKPLKEFKGDTLAYFNYNFKEHKDFYIGKKFFVLFNDVENNPKVTPASYYIKEIKRKIISGTYVYTEPEKYRRAFSALPLEERVKKARYYDDIYVYFDEDNTIDAEEYYNVCWKEKRAESKDDDDFSSKLADCIFDCVIKDIGISHTDMRPVQYRH
ncbi:MAG: hypothetical protein J6K01_09335 [Paludibacteraceae bacterium]|nr:hypothetical protein [Paludibacteraceae bacterium]